MNKNMNLPADPVSRESGIPDKVGCGLGHILADSICGTAQNGEEVALTVALLFSQSLEAEMPQI